IVELLVGLGILSLRTWARALGVLLLMLNTIVQFAFIAAFPIWTLAAIIINIAAICALMRSLEDYTPRRVEKGTAWKRPHATVPHRARSPFCSSAGSPSPPHSPSRRGS